MRAGGWMGAGSSPRIVRAFTLAPLSPSPPTAPLSAPSRLCRRPSPMTSARREWLRSDLPG
eukprot:328734-Hanusia_phi.AAC.6